MTCGRRAMTLERLCKRNSIQWQRPCALCALGLCTGFALAPARSCDPHALVQVVLKPVAAVAAALRTAFLRCTCVLYALTRLAPLQRPPSPCSSSARTSGTTSRCAAPLPSSWRTSSTRAWRTRCDQSVIGFVFGGSFLLCFLPWLCFLARLINQGVAHEVG